MGRRDRPPASSPTITWRPTTVRDLLEARLVSEDDRGGPGLYVGYVARLAGHGDEAWRGYVGLTHVPVAVGTREAVQVAVERAAREAWAARRARRTAAVRDQGQ